MTRKAQTEKHPKWRYMIVVPLCDVAFAVCFMAAFKRLFMSAKDLMLTSQQLMQEHVSLLSQNNMYAALEVADQIAATHKHVIGYVFLVLLSGFVLWTIFEGCAWFFLHRVRHQINIRRFVLYVVATNACATFLLAACIVGFAFLVRYEVLSESSLKPLLLALLVLIQYAAYTLYTYAGTHKRVVWKRTVLPYGLFLVTLVALTALLTWTMSFMFLVPFMTLLFLYLPGLTLARYFFVHQL